ncbi:YolD-like family protein [Cytobacillus purgationiresistens]|uniref:YolD-like family protein n=1 Tax=Cytobacillus purgationiresistens TaxID=863449 RepID=A0ABU0ABP7_9BACI|nr:YolD-like family protein [Cytobacillus purgationiresistens]MDQ0268676.1 hypothetical protein [Cytobacillus purgationiresistens]
MIRDRGKMKWQGAFFMPEHVKLLSDIQTNSNKQAKPHLDEQELEEIQIIVMESLHYTLPIKITTWKNGFFKHSTRVVDTVDMVKMQIRFVVNEEKNYIFIKDITSVERV